MFDQRREKIARDGREWRIGTNDAVNRRRLQPPSEPVRSVHDRPRLRVSLSMHADRVLSIDAGGGAAGDAHPGVDARAGVEGRVRRVNVCHTANARAQPSAKGGEEKAWGRVFAHRGSQDCPLSRS